MSGAAGPLGEAPGQRVLDQHAHLVMRRVARTFDLATRLMPRPVRRDVRRLYLVLRTLDDLVDDGRPEAAAAIAAVEAWASGVATPPLVDAGPAPDTLDPASLTAILDDLATRHPAMPRDAVADFATGMRADMSGPRHRTDEDLARYCYQVAGTVGRLMACLLGVRDGHEGEADLAARSLGCAMQRTNILRDVVEDARAGRVYLADDDLAAVGVEPGEAASRLLELASWEAPRRAALFEAQRARAEADYAAGLAGVPHLRRGRRSITAAALMYREILAQIERDGFGARRQRSVVGRARKLVLVARAVVRGP
jgi:15-cis-phytoene synthase